MQEVNRSATERAMAGHREVSTCKEKYGAPCHTTDVLLGNWHRHMVTSTL